VLLSSIPKADAKILAIRWPDGDVQRASLAEVIASQADHVDGHMEDICHIIDQYKKSNLVLIPGRIFGSQRST
jgi:hypothetical protein